MPTIDDLWLPPNAKQSLLTIKGACRLQVGYPDHPDKGELVDTGWMKNTVLPWLPWQLWCSLCFTNGVPGQRYVDGVNVYPSLGDIWCDYTAAPTNAIYRNASSGVGVSSPVSTDTGGGGPVFIFDALMAGMAIGNYIAGAPAGNVSTFSQSSWTSYSLIRRASAVNSSPVFKNDNVYYGPAVNVDTLSGVPSPNPSSSVSRTFAAQAGTVNAVAFVPLAPTAVTANTAQAAGPYGNYLIAQAGGEGTVLSPTSFVKALAGAGDPFSTVAAASIVAATFFLAAAPVTIPTGANLTVTYAFSGTL